MMTRADQGRVRLPAPESIIRNEKRMPWVMS